MVNLVKIKMILNIGLTWFSVIGLFLQFSHIAYIPVVTFFILLWYKII
jgi:hypothetical protein